MSKKVLVISSSPRLGGNSDYLCDEFIKGANETGNLCEKVFLRNLDMGYCLGCGVCNKTHKCVQNDDMKSVLDKIVDADVIVLATPVYFYSMDAQLKTLIDRTVPRYNEIANKDFYFIVTAADSNEEMMQRTIEGLRGFTEDCLNGAVEKMIIYGLCAWQMGDIKNNRAVAQAYQAGLNV